VWRGKWPEAWHSRSEGRKLRWRPLGHVAGASGHGIGRNSAPSSSTWKIFSPQGIIWASTSTNHVAGFNHDTRPQAAIFSVLWIFSVHCTISFSFSHPDRPLCREICSQFLVVTRPSLCIKVVALWSSYNLAIATIVKQLLDHGRIQSQSLPNYTVTPYSVHWLTVSLTLDLIISTFYMTPRFNHLSKVELL
jgi:hypothetical protein